MSSHCAARHAALTNALSPGNVFLGDGDAAVTSEETRWPPLQLPSFRIDCQRYRNRPGSSSARPGINQWIRFHCPHGLNVELLCVVNGNGLTWDLYQRHPGDQRLRWHTATAQTRPACLPSLRDGWELLSGLHWGRARYHQDGEVGRVCLVVDDSLLCNTGLSARGQGLPVLGFGSNCG